MVIPTMPSESRADRLPDFIREIYPFPSRLLTIDGINLHYIDAGPADAPPVLMLHGNPTWSFMYRHLINALKSDRRVIAVDHIGCGLSDKPQNYSYRLEAHIRNVSALIDSLNLTNISLIVHDWGGAIGMGVATRRPDRFERFVIMNTGAWNSNAMPWRIMAGRCPLFGALAIRGFNAFARGALSMALEFPDRLTEIEKSGYLFPYDNWSNRIATLRFVQDIPMTRRHPTYETLDAISNALDVLKPKPMLIEWGMKDWCFTPLFLDGWRARFPDAIVEEHAAAGHYVFEDARAELTESVSAFILGS